MDRNHIVKMDTFSKIERSQIMAKVKSKGNRSTELKAIQIFNELKIRGWRRNYPVKGKPDFVFLKYKIAVFIDGCFWHGCKDHCRMPNSNQDYWQKKIKKNKNRDIIVNTKFISRKWIVIRIWEHDLKRPINLKPFIELKKIIKSKTI